MFLTTFLLSSTALMAQETKSMSLEKMNWNLTKIKKSVRETKKRIKSVKDASFLPDLYFALAEFYIDEAKYMYFIKVAENKGTPVEELDFTREKRLKILAIKAYDHIIEKFLKLPERDKAIFLKAHELQGLGRLEDMIRTLGKLTREYPKSQYWEEAQIIIGTYFLEKKKQLDIALEIFESIIRRPITHLTPITYYKMGWLYINKNKFYKSLVSFEKALTTGHNVNLSKLPELYRKSDIRRESLMAMVWPYSELNPSQMIRGGKNRKKVIDYFYDLSPDQISFQRVLSKLGGRLTLKKKFISATKVYFELLRTTTNLEKRLEIIEKLYVSMKNTQRDWPLNGFIQEIVGTLIDVKTSPFLKKSIVKKSIHDFEIFTRDVATRQHQRAKRTRKDEDWQLTIENYKSYLWAFPKSKYAKKIRVNLAESYFNSHQYLNAAKEYEKITRRQSRKYRKSYFDSSIQSYVFSIRNESELNRLEVKEARYGLRSVGRYFIKNYPNDKAVAGILFNIAQTYYDERNFYKSLSYFKKYIKKYPKGRDVKIAVHLILDSFNQVDDFKGLIREGKWILSQKRLRDPSLRSQVRQIIQQADFEKVLGRVQDFDSDSYAQNLLKLAGKYKGSKLGDQALYQAFVAFKSKKDIKKAYESGEQLVFQHGSSKYAQEVTNQMVQLALTSSDFRRAATYLELFQNKYPRVKGATEYLKNAASIRESMGDFKVAARSYKKLGNYQSVAKMDYLAQDWSSLKQTAQKASGIYASYWKGLAQYRLRGLGAARKALTRASQTPAVSNYKEKEAAAHALYLLSMGDFEHYQRIKLTAGNETQAVHDKLAQLKRLEKKLNQVIQFGNGRWAIAGLYELGKSYKEFSKFVHGAPIPRGLSSVEKKEFKNVVKSQAKKYGQTAHQFFKQCLSVAAKYHVFTTFVKGCQSQGQRTVDEASETRITTRARDASPKGARSLRKKLIDFPRDIKLINRLAELYVKSKDFSMAGLILHHALEFKKKNPSLLAKLGSIELYKNDPTSASEWFKKALVIDKSHPLASLGMAGLYKKYGYKKDFKKYKGKIKVQKSVFIHPIMTKAL